MDSRHIRAGGLFIVFVFPVFFEALARLYTPYMRVAFWPLFNILYAYLSKKKEFPTRQVEDTPLCDVS